jgi:hypothetical protein
LSFSSQLLLISIRLFGAPRLGAFGLFNLVNFDDPLRGSERITFSSVFTFCDFTPSSANGKQS